MNTPCDCPLAGWCPRHRFHTTPHEHRLCQVHQRWFDLFASGSSPQHAREAARNGHVPVFGSEGFGDTVAWLIEKLTFGKVKACGGCKKRRRWLNRMFPYRTRQHSR